VSLIAGWVALFVFIFFLRRCRRRSELINSTIFRGRIIERRSKIVDRFDYRFRLITAAAVSDQSDAFPFVVFRVRRIISISFVARAVIYFSGFCVSRVRDPRS
jgi:hypothetical protein